MQKHILIINAHQRYEGFAEGKLNQSMTDLAASTLKSAGHQVQLTSLESGYAISEEISKHEWADTVIIQTPVYWFGIPWLFKKYIDEVYTSAMGTLWESDGRSSTDASRKYGSGGLTRGKQYFISTTWNAPREAFNEQDQFFEGFSVDTVFLSLHKLYQFLGMQPLPGFNCYDVIKNPRIEEDMMNYEQHIRQVIMQPQGLSA